MKTEWKLGLYIGLYRSGYMELPRSNGPSLGVPKSGSPISGNSPCWVWFCGERARVYEKKLKVTRVQGLGVNPKP